MSISEIVICPQCRGQIAKDPQLAGKQVSCPHCNRAFLMPDAKLIEPPQTIRAAMDSAQPSESNSRGRSFGTSPQPHQAEKIVFGCPQCRQRLAVSSLSKGRLECPKCLAQVTIPTHTDNTIPPPLPAAGNVQIDQWYCTRQGKQLGPVSLQQLHQAVAAGQLLSTDLVWKQGMPSWIQVGNVEELLPEPPSVPPPLPLDVAAPTEPTLGLPQDRRIPAKSTSKESFWTASYNVLINVMPTFSRFVTPNAYQNRNIKSADEAYRHFKNHPTGKVIVVVVPIFLALCSVLLFSSKLHLVSQKIGDSKTSTNAAKSLDTNMANDFGTELKLNGGQLFFKPPVSETDAKQLGMYLMDNGFFSGEPKLMQLKKSGSRYDLCLVIKEGIQQNPQMIEDIKAFAHELSGNVFNNKPVNIHLCDQQLKTIRVVTP